MGIQMTTPMSAIDAYIKQQLERQERAIIYNFHAIGIKCINEARDNGTYDDITGNLRSSVGYVVVKDGTIIHESTFDMKEEGWDGKAAGENAIREQVAKYPHGIVLIVVAGMNYAAAVEAKNFNVLSSAELLAERMVADLIKKLKKK